MSRFIEILASLERHGAEYVIVGGMAAVIHGAPVLTMDIDALVRVSEDNANRLLAVFKELEARFRGHTTIIRPELADIMAGRHLLLTTKAGKFDVLGAMGRTPHRIDDVRDEIVRLQIDGLTVPVLGLEELIRQKRALGRDKDLVALRMLEEVARQRGLRSGG
jgi:predicted nucleotidyltransferase